MANYSGKKGMCVLDKQSTKYRSGKIIEDTRYSYKIQFEDSVALVDKKNEEKVLEFLD